MNSNKKPIFFLQRTSLFLLFILPFFLESCSGSTPSINSTSSTATLPSQVLFVPTFTPSLQPSTTISASTSVKTNAAQRWLKSVPCRPPCFENIRPGETTLLQALDILNHNAFIHNIQNIVSSKYPDRGNITWDWGSINPREKGSALYNPQATNPTITTISFTPSTELAFSDVISSFGIPDGVIATADYGPDTDMYYTLFFIYSFQGFILWGDQNLHPIPSISGAIPIINITFFPPSAQGLASALSGMGVNQSASFNQPWHGFDSFSSYCTHAFCRAVQTPHN